MMRAFFPIFASLVTTCGFLQAVNPRQVIVTPNELTGYGDFDSDGDLDAIVVERGSGLFRVAFQQGDGSLIWTKARPSGLPSVDSMTCGPIRQSGKDAVILGGRLANQMVLMEPLPSGGAIREQIIPSGVGPSSVAAIDLPVAGNDPALMDLVVHTGENNSPNFEQRHIFKSLTTGTSEELTANLSVVVERGSRYRYSATGTDFYAAILRGGSERIRIYRNTTTSLPIKQTISVRTGSEFLAGPFSPTLNQHLLVYVPGDAELQVGLSNGASLATPVTHVLDDPIGSIHPVGSGSFFVISVSGAKGRLYTLDLAGVPIAGDVFGASDGGRLRGVMGFDDVRMSMLVGPASGGPATHSIDYTFSGGKWGQTGKTTLPSAGSQVALTNVLLYDGEPLIDPESKLVETIQIPDWTSGLTITAGGNVMLTPETFESETQGLGAGGSTTFTPASNPTHVLGNQYEGAVSILSQQTFVGLLPPQVTVSPLPGKYTSVVSPVLSSPDATTSIFYRFNGAGNWQNTVSGTALTATGDTLETFTLEYYATNTGGGRSPIYQASYIYYGEPGDLDSDGDKVPDFVEIANGLDPNGGKDSDLDSVDDLYELVLGTDSDDPASVPATPISLNLQNVFDLAVTPASFTAPNTLAGTYPEGGAESPTDLYLHSLDGTLLGHEVTRSVVGYPQPTALFEKVPATDRDLFVIVSTSPTFPIRPVVTSDHGRELIGLIPVPYQEVGEFDFTYDGSSTTTAAAADWVTAAQSHYLGQTRTTIAENLTPDDSLAFLLTERLIREFLVARNPALGGSHLSLTGFRDQKAPSTMADVVSGQPFSATQSELLSLQTYQSSAIKGHLLQHVFTEVGKQLAVNPTPEMIAMKKLSSNIAYLSDFVDPDTPAGLYPNPFDTLREVIRQLATKSAQVDGMISLPGHENGVSYARNVTSTVAEIASADQVLAQLLTAIGDRATTTLTLEVKDNSFSEGMVPVLISSSGLPYQLYRSDGTPYLFQEPLPVGAEVEVFAYTDRAELPSVLGTPLDVISAELVSVPQPAFVDSDGNVLDDEWEFFFFGGSVDAFADSDGDGYSNLQELFEGTNPILSSSKPSGEAVPLAPPKVRISQLPGGDVQLDVEFPSIYADQICFSLYTQTDLSLPFEKVPGSEAIDAGSDVYRLEVPISAARAEFYRFRLELVK